MKHYSTTVIYLSAFFPQTNLHGRTSYIILRPRASENAGGARLKILKDFKTRTPEHSAEHQVFAVGQGLGGGGLGHCRGPHPRSQPCSDGHDLSLNLYLQPRGSAQCLRVSPGNACGKTEPGNNKALGLHGTPPRKVGFVCNKK